MGGDGRLRFGPAGTESGFCRTGGGGGKLRGSLSAAFAGAGIGVASSLAFAVLGRGGIDDGRGGIDERPDAGRGGDGFFDWFASSAMGRS